MLAGDRRPVIADCGTRSESGPPANPCTDLDARALRLGNLASGLETTILGAKFLRTGRLHHGSPMRCSIQMVRTRVRLRRLVI